MTSTKAAAVFAAPADAEITTARVAAPGLDEPDRLATWAHWLSLALAAGFLVWIGRGHWFVSDEWEFLTNRGVSGAALDLFVPHTQHWSTGPILFYRALVNLFGLHTYVPYLMGSIVAHLLVAHFAWRIAIRAGAPAWIATGLTALFLVVDPMATSVLFAFQISFEGSVAFGLGLLLLVDGAERQSGERASGTVDPAAASTGRIVLIAVVAIASLTFSSVSLPLIASAAALALVRLGWRATALAFAPSALTFAIWYQLAGKSGLEGAGGMHLSGPVLRDAPAFVWEGLAESVANPLRISGTWAGVVLLALVATFVWIVARRWEGRMVIAVASGLGGVVFFSLTALGRASDGPTASRYLYIGAAMLLPIGALAIERLARIGSVVRWALGAGLVVALVLNANALGNRAETERARIALGRDQILAAAQVLRSGAAIPGDVYPELVTDPDLSIAKLRALIAAGWVPESAPVSDDALERARTYPHIRVTARPPANARAPELVEPGPAATLDACARIADPEPARAVVRATGVATLRLSVPNDTYVQIHPADAGGNPVGMVMVLIMDADRPVYLTFTAPDDVLLAPYYGPFDVCPVGATPAE